MDKRFAITTLELVYKQAAKGRPLQPPSILGIM